MKLLVCNTYGGSLLIAAQHRKDEVVASLEDANYGVPIQLENFPNLNVYPTDDTWPDLKLRDTFVIAHPPCAAFSNQNRGNAKFRGADAPKVKCTGRVMEYALSRRAPYVAIESVPGALEGLRSLHDSYARRYGYTSYRLLLNTCTFGVPQYRNRFWMIFARHSNPLRVALTPRRKTVGDVIKESRGAKLTPIEYIENQADKQLMLLSKLMPPAEVEKFLTTSNGSVVKALPEYLGKTGEDAEEIRRVGAMGWNYTSHSMIMLRPDWLAPVLIAGSWWWYKTRCLAEEEYKAVMDFPRDYKFPGDYYRKRIREFLSRGVAPATAEFVLRIGAENLGLEKPKDGTLGLVLRPNETLDLRVSGKARHGGEHTLKCQQS